MSKSTRKIYDAQRAAAIKWVANQFKVTEQYVRQIDNNLSQSSGQSDEIRKAFRAKYAELKKVLQ